MTLPSLDILRDNCVYASIEGDSIVCTKKIAKNPPLAWCVNSCLHKATAADLERMKAPANFVTRRGMKPPRNRMGLGDLVEKGISLATFGQGKRLADKLARKQGKKGCGCQKRKEAFNNLGKKIGL